MLGLAGPLAGLAVLLTMFSPQARQAIPAVGGILLCGLGLAVVGLIVFAICRHSTRSNKPEVIECNVNWAALNVSNAGRGTKSQSTTDLLEQLRAIDWFQFEKLIAVTYRKLGYSVNRRGGANPDGGIDLVIAKNGRRSAVQCKHWKTWNVGVKAVREFLGALKDSGIETGIIITLRGYTGDAKLLAEKHGIEIVNETGLAKMFEATNARFDPETLAILHDKRKFCPKCESDMVLRTARNGNNAGRKFWGCSKYPQCRFILDA